MTNEEKTYRVACAACGKTFHVRFPLVDDSAEGEGEQTVHCGKCGKQIKITLKRKYMQPGDILKSWKLEDE
jgi:transcription elongation factor Elf1